MINNTFSKFERNVISIILTYKRKGVESSFKELFEHILNTLFKNIGIQITKESVIISFYEQTQTEDMIRTKEKIYELILLLDKLKMEYNFFYNIPKEVSYFVHCFYNDRVYVNTRIKLEEKTSNILNLIFSNYFITSDLRDLKNIKFKSIERKNLEWTKWALIIGAIFSILSFCLEIYQVISINEVKILNLKEIKKDINIFLLK
ncbi:hypothetical protein [Fusobacterium polymorphum]|uniref:hypothetical protein n=1 Tax=Fusobacterium nucleatum subsp. polymorphum TaxID=76857 RepID=UPI003008D1C5